MKLPEQQYPTYQLELPISKAKIRFRPYLVKEQKILMMASESKEEQTLIDAMIQVMNNCLLTDLDISKLPQVDVEYYFYQLIARSQSEIVTSKYICENVVNGEKCGFIMESEFNLTTDLEVINKESNGLIPLNDTMGIKFHTPYFELDNLNVDLDNATTEDIFNEIIKNIDYIYDDNNTYRIDEMSKEQLNSFIEGLTTQQFEQIDNFFSNLPKIIKTLNVTCGKCGYKHKIIVEDIFNFFI